MKRILAVTALYLALCLTLSVTGLAAEISTVNSDNLPTVTVELNGVNQPIDPSEITATLDGQPLKVTDVDLGGSTEWIIMVDTSQSYTEAYFKATQKELKNLYNSLGEHETMQLYYFDSEIKQVLSGSESKEEAARKIDNIAYNGQYTVFYEALTKLSALAAASDADTVIPVIFTDGVNTSDSATKEDAEAAIAAMPDTFRAFFPDDPSRGDNEEKKQSFSDLMEPAENGAVFYNTETLGDKFDAVNAANQSATLTFTVPEGVTANENAALVVDLGDGEPLTAETPVKDWSPEPATEPATEPSTGDNVDEKSTSPIVFAAIAVVLLVVVAAVLFLKKGKKKPAEEETEDAKKAKKQKAPKPEKQPTDEKDEDKGPKDRKERAGERAAKERDRIVKERQEAEEKAKKDQEKATAKAAKEAEEAAAKAKAEKEKKKGAEITVAAAKEGKFDSKAAARAAKERDKVAKERQEAEYKAKLEQEKAEVKAAKEANAQQEKENKKKAKEKDKNALMFTIPGDSKSDSKAAAKAAKERQKAADKLAAEKKAAEEKANKEAAAAAKKAEPSKREQRAQRKEEQSFKFYFQDDNSDNSKE